MSGIDVPPKHNALLTMGGQTVLLTKHEIEWSESLVGTEHGCWVCDQIEVLQIQIASYNHTAGRNRRVDWRSKPWQPQNCGEQRQEYRLDHGTG